jgi:hypothetical protein
MRIWLRPNTQIKTCRFFLRVSGGASASPKTLLAGDVDCCNNVPVLENGHVKRVVRDACNV